MLMHFDRQQFEALLSALHSAFYSRSSLEQMVFFSLETSLDDIVPAQAPLPNQLFHLIRWAKSNGKLEELIKGACKANPGNPRLRALAEQLGIDFPAAALLPDRRRPEYPFPETWKCDLSMIEDCVEALDRPGTLFGFAVSCNYDAFRESFSRRLEHVLGRGKLDVIAPYTLSRLDTIDTVHSHARRLELLKDKLRYRDLLCGVKLASDNELIMSQQASALWRALGAAFAGDHEHRLIVVLFTQADFDLPDGMIRLAPPSFRPVHVKEWVRDFARALDWEDRYLIDWMQRIIAHSAVHQHSPHQLHVELVYAYLARSLELLRTKPPPSPSEFLENLY